ncbi:MAG TPA: GAF domain-containing SpoIIE family protein phosphatase [Bacteroidota bacterium]|nr:GAF domain-containing SpoIIE family protein phosphatase [Bacteroidota bacterium]
MASSKSLSTAKRGEIRRLEALVNASKILNSTLDLEKLLTLILELASKNLNASRGTIYLIDQERKELWSKVLKGRNLVEIRLPVGTGIAGTVAKTGKTINLRDAWKDKRFFSGFDLRTGFQTKTMLCMPMKDRKGKIIGVFQILNKIAGSFDKEDETFLEAFSVHAALAIENARLHQDIVEKQRIEKELEIAGHIQRRLLPKELPAINGYEIDAVARPSKLVGGDYYDFIPLTDGTYAVVIADVSGKGVPAALLVSTLHATLHAYIEGTRDLAALVRRLNDVIHLNTEAERYITMFMAILDPVHGKVTYVNAGHNSPYVIKSRQVSITPLPATGLPVGMFGGVEFEQVTCSLDPNDFLVLYTDGVTEAMNKSFEEFGETRFHQAMVGQSGKSAAGFLGGVVAEVERFVAGEPQSDDITMMVLKRVS